VRELAKSPECANPTHITRDKKDTTRHLRCLIAHLLYFIIPYLVLSFPKEDILEKNVENFPNPVTQSYKKWIKKGANIPQGV
jgi:hypothetical protein